MNDAGSPGITSITENITNEATKRLIIKDSKRLRIYRTTTASLAEAVVNLKD
jgi:hypothetical protein|tara:strand:- start:204 stop:359 length:156 start_codon:yes stop_codon:yes gene_type:complete